MFYVHRYSIVEADRGENGNIIITDELGNKREINDKDFYDDYVVVRKLRKTKTIRQSSPFEIAYAEQLANFSLDNNVEDEQYITGTKNLTSNKAF